MPRLISKHDFSLHTHSANRLLIKLLATELKSDTYKLYRKEPITVMTHSRYLKGTSDRSKKQLILLLIMELCRYDSAVRIDDEVDWLECISAIETNQGLIYFCDAKYQKEQELDGMAEFVAKYEAGTCLYSITGYNPYNKITNRVQNEIMNHFLLEDLRKYLPNCTITRNFSYFPRRPYHFERGYTIQVPPEYPVKNHGMIIYSLAVKYKQAAFFKGVVLDNGLTIPYVVLVQGEYKEIKEELVTISHNEIHPAFLHRANNSIFKDISEALTLLYQTSDKIPLCHDLYEIFKQNYRPISELDKRHPIITVEGIRSFDTAQSVSMMLDATYCGNTPRCLKDMRSKFEHSTILLALYKTIADYIQSSVIAQKSQTQTVVVNKYWYNTAASLIVHEVNAGNKNIPPKDHQVYRWPEGLVKPDAVILLNKKFKTAVSQKRQKMKSSCLKRMQADDWISLNCSDKSPVDMVAPRIVDELTHKGIIRARGMVDKLCPAADSGPLSVLQDDPTDRIKTIDATTKITENNNEWTEKPFWW